MPAASPLDHEELRQIEKSLDAGNLAEAAQKLAPFANSREHDSAITFLATRLLFQRGRVDAAGAADRLKTLLGRVEHFPEAEDWLAELEGRTERSALGDAAPSHPAVDASSEEQTSPNLSVSASQAPSVPRAAAVGHPYLDEFEDEEVTPTEALEAAPAAPLSDPPASTQPPPAPERARGSVAPATDQKLSNAPSAPMRPRFDSLRAKEQLSSEAGRYRAISHPDQTRNELTGSAGPSAGGRSIPPSLRRQIMEAWDHALHGRLESARELLPEEPAPALDPELHVALSRVLLELGEAERAAAEADRALEAAPGLAEARLMLIWSAVRHARARDDNWWLERASRVLKDSNLTPVAEPGLVDALTACIEARIGTPAVGLQLAQRALRWNAESIDGLAALAESASLCHEARRAEVALERLFSVSESAAEQIAPRLRRLGVGENGPTSSASVWLPLEHALSSSARDIALEGLETLAAERLSLFSIERPETREQAGKAIGEFLTLAPIFRHFGSYDFSVASVDRLETALGLLYGSGPVALDVPRASAALWQLGGLYLGEVLRQRFAGRWQANGDLKEAAILVAGREVRPFQIVRNRIAHGRHATLAAALTGVLEQDPAKPGRPVGSPALSRPAGSPALSPPLPWGDRAWPPLEDLPRLGRALAHSVVAVYAAQHGVPALDRTSKSLPALDRYLALVAPAGARLTEDTPWARWLSVFVGAYLGEVLCRDFAGVWVGADGSGARAVAVQLGKRRIAPLMLILDIVTGHTELSLQEFAADLRHGTVAPSRSRG